VAGFAATTFFSGPRAFSTPSLLATLRSETMCGIFALISGNVECNDAAVDLHEALYALQHRGQVGNLVTSEPPNHSQVTGCLRYRDIAQFRPNLLVQGQRFGVESLSRRLDCSRTPRLHGSWPPPIPHRRNVVQRREPALLRQLVSSTIRDTAQIKSMLIVTVHMASSSRTMGGSY